MVRRVANSKIVFPEPINFGLVVEEGSTEELTVR